MHVFKTLNCDRVACDTLDQFSVYAACYVVYICIPAGQDMGGFYWLFSLVWPHVG